MEGDFAQTLKGWLVAAGDVVARGAGWFAEHPSVIENIVAVLILIGAFFALVGAIGLVRLPDFLTRLHAPTKASTLGVGGVLLGALLIPLSSGKVPALAELLLTLFVFISAPVSANVLALASMRLHGDFDRGTGGGPDAAPDAALPQAAEPR